MFKKQYCLLIALLLFITGCGFGYYTGYVASISLIITDQKGNHVEGAHVIFLDKNEQVTFEQNIENKTYVDWKDFNITKTFVTEMEVRKSTFRANRAVVAKVKNSVKAIVSAKNCKTSAIPINFTHKKVSRSILRATDPLNRYVFEKTIELECNN